MPKYKPQFFKPEGMNTQDHFMLGTVWNIQGSRGNTYEVELNPAGFDCSCPGFGFHGRCKHVRAVADRFTADRVPEYKAA